MATGPTARAMSVPPASMTISDQPAGPAPEAEDADDEGRPARMTHGSGSPSLAKSAGAEGLAETADATADAYGGRHVPAWLRETGTCFLTNPQLVLYGNIRDNYLVPHGETWQLLDVREALWWLMKPLGYRFLLVVDPVDGMHVLPDDEEVRESVAALTSVALGEQPLSLDTLLGVLRAVSGSRDTKAGVMVDYASRLVRDVRQLSPEEHYFFAACEKASPTRRSSCATGATAWRHRATTRCCGWPTTTGTSPRGSPRTPWPSDGSPYHCRTSVTAGGGNCCGGGISSHMPGEAANDVAYRFAEQTESLTVRSMMEIIRLARTREGAVDSIEAAARCYRVGISDNPWSKPFLGGAATAAERIRERVRGQDEAIEQSVDIIIRSVMGLSGAQAASNASRPRGVLFFAGPTGVGKTELAKSLTELIFGDERAYIRFDMTEFSAEHSAARLIGAPPGYIGHDAGGELTDSVRERPFSLILFDEIEKAHPGSWTSSFRSSTTAASPTARAPPSTSRKPCSSSPRTSACRCSTSAACRCTT
ncbi:hypothetical protein SALBM135S_09631 [Streptomyces alboniger]